MKFKRTIIILVILILVFIPSSKAMVPQLNAYVDNKGIAMLLKSLEILKYVLPSTFLIIKIIIDRKDENNKNRIRKIIKYLIIVGILYLSFLSLENIVAQKYIKYSHAYYEYSIKYDGFMLYYEHNAYK